MACNYPANPLDWDEDSTIAAPSDDTPASTNLPTRRKPARVASLGQINSQPKSGNNRKHNLDVHHGGNGGAQGFANAGPPAPHGQSYQNKGMCCHSHFPTPN